MYFTREPIIETIISPREGYKLVLRSSKHEKQDEYCVDSVEVVNFGNHCFYRSLDRNVTFLLPVFDYEIVEARSARLTMKTSGVLQDKEIKIGKGKEESFSDEKKKDKRSSKKRKDKEKGGAIREEQPPLVEEEIELPLMEEQPKAKPKAEPIPRALIPPPTTLISDSLSRYTQLQAKEHPLQDELVLPEEDEVEMMVSDEEESDLPF